MSGGNRILLIFASGVLIGFIGWFALTVVSNPPPDPETAFGVTFSTKYARQLGLDWRETYLSILDDLGVRKLRIPVYWDDVESRRDVFDWSEIDWMLAQAEERGAEVILVIGRKVPRWPECHEPDWTGTLPESEMRERVLRLIEAEVAHFRDSRAVALWQVENEPLFRFGDCPDPDRAFLEKEIAAVRALDDRPVMVTDSGELSTWVPAASLADVLGISMYRLVWNKHLGFLFWPLTPRYYAERLRIIRPLVDRVMVSELQAEPWFPRPIEETPIEEQKEVMSIDRFRNNADFARRTGADEIYLWGVEWWFWLAERGDHSFLEEASGLFRATMKQDL